MSRSKQQLRQAFQDSEYRFGYLDSFLDSWIARQIKILREQRGWSQKDLAERAGTHQSRISDYEQEDHSSVTVASLKRLAEAFDCSLNISFESFSRLVDRIDRTGRSQMMVQPFDEDIWMTDAGAEVTEALDSSVRQLVKSPPFQKKIQTLKLTTELHSETVSTSKPSLQAVPLVGTEKIAA